MIDRDELIVENMNRAAAVARSIHRRMPKHIEVRDIEQDAMVGLVQAAIRYDEAQGDFWRFAKQRIFGQIYDRVRMNCPSRRCKIAWAFEIQLDDKFDHPSPQPVWDDLIDAHTAMATLRHKERGILMDYYFRQMTTEEIAAPLGVAASRISQINGKSLKKLRPLLS